MMTHSPAVYSGYYEVDMRRRELKYNSGPLFSSWAFPTWIYLKSGGGSRRGEGQKRKDERYIGRLFQNSSPVSKDDRDCKDSEKRGVGMLKRIQFREVYY